MDKKKQAQVVIMVAAVFLCGIVYLFFGPGSKGAGTGDDEFVAGGSPQAIEKAASAGSEPEEATAGQKTAQVTTVCVYVCGAVRKPGVYEFDHSPRVLEAVDKAGGFTKKADTLSVNLASMLEDGSQVVIAEKGKSGGEAGGTGKTGNVSSDSASSGSSSSGDRIDINTAGAEELTKIPGIGEAKSTAIVNYRNEHGRFQKPEDLMQIPGIKEGIFNRIKDYIRV